MEPSLAGHNWVGSTHAFIHSSIHSHSLHMIIHLFSRLRSRGYWDVRILRIKYSLSLKELLSLELRLAGVYLDRLRAEPGSGGQGQTHLLEPPEPEIAGCE